MLSSKEVERKDTRVWEEREMRRMEGEKRGDREGKQSWRKQIGRGKVRSVEADGAAGPSFSSEQRWQPRFPSTRKSAAAASSQKRKKKSKKKRAQQCHVLLHHWVGLEDSGPTSDEGSHMPLGCVPFYWAELASVHACNYSYSICVQGIVWSTAVLCNY